jgi:hypothetical protein
MARTILLKTKEVRELVCEIEEEEATVVVVRSSSSIRINSLF